MAEERLQKIISATGIASRRKAEELIVTGHVSVNGKTITELGSKADLEVDNIKVNGQRLTAPQNHVYFALNKPKNVVTTVHDPQGRETVMQFFKGLRERIYPVGRLDYASEGLILLTNDGDFAAKLMSPASHVTKTYLAKANGALTIEQEEQFRRGIPMHGRRTAPAGIRLIKDVDNPWYEVRLVEGRQNQIRVMFKHFGRLVEKLKRVKIGFLELGALKPGAYRTLTRSEVERFQKLLNSSAPEDSAAPEVEGNEDAKVTERRRTEVPLRRRREDKTERFRRNGGPRKSFPRRNESGRAFGKRKPFPPPQERSREGTSPDETAERPRRFGTKQPGGLGSPRFEKRSGPDRPSRPRKWGSSRSTGESRKMEGSSSQEGSARGKFAGPRKPLRGGSRPSGSSRPPMAKRPGGPNRGGRPGRPGDKGR